MTEKQRDYLKYLEEISYRFDIDTAIKTMLDDDWKDHWQNVVPSYASECIAKTRSQILSTNPMAFSKRELEYAERSIIEKNLINIKPGDEVKIVNRTVIGRRCHEEAFHQGESLKVLDGLRQIGNQWCARIEKEGWFNILFLEKVTV